jgi:cell division protein FtsZ
MTIINFKNTNKRVKVVGIGGAGTNVLETLIQRGYDTSNTISINTDRLKHEKSSANRKILIGINEVMGCGSGGDQSIGQKCAISDSKLISETIKDCDILFVLAGLGKGTGSGVAPLVCKIAKELNILTIAIVNTPFSYEGNRKIQISSDSVVELQKYSHAVMPYSNDKITKHYGCKNAHEVFKQASLIPINAISSIHNVLSGEGTINIDLSALNRTLENCSRVLINSVKFDTSRNIEDIISELSNNPVIDCSIEDSSSAIVYFDIGREVSMQLIEMICNFIKIKSKNNNLDVNCGMRLNETIAENEIELTIIMPCESIANKIIKNDHKVNTFATTNRNTAIDKTRTMLMNSRTNRNVKSSNIAHEQLTIDQTLSDQKEYVIKTDELTYDERLKKTIDVLSHSLNVKATKDIMLMSFEGNKND